VDKHQQAPQGGWIRLWRQALDSDLFADPHLWHLFTWCLLRANHSHCSVRVKTGRGFTVVDVLPGQFIFGRKSASRELNLPESTLNDRMKKLEEKNSINIKPDTHFSIVSIVNWQHFQSENGEVQQATDRQATGKQQASDTDKKEKKEKNEEKNKPPIVPQGTCDGVEPEHPKQSEYSAQFLQFWESYPTVRRTGKRAAWKAWQSAIKRALAAIILKAVKEFADSPQGKSRFCPSPTSWLNQDRWEDEREAWQRSGEDGDLPRHKEAPMKEYV
jgi:hypothetical protein